MARTVADCVPLLAAMAGPDWADATTGFARFDSPAAPNALRGLRIALSPRLADRVIDPDVAERFTEACDAARSAGATVLDLAVPSPATEPGRDSLALLTTDMLAWHRRFADRRDEYQPSTSQLLETGEHLALSGLQYVELQQRRRDTTLRWRRWLDEHRVDLLLEPTLPVVAPLRGSGYQNAGSDVDLISLTALWNWTGFPVVSFPSGLGRRSALPTGVSLIGAPGSDAVVGFEQLLRR
jgi:aspartyl-tRNA(Asn)/glutamyl-tRNA(Gln) amidotransferase subunit A